MKLLTHYLPSPQIHTHKVTEKPKCKIGPDGGNSWWRYGWRKGFLHFHEAIIHPLKANSPSAFPACVTFPVSSHLSVTPLVSPATNQSSSAPLWPSGPINRLWPSPVISTGASQFTLLFHREKFLKSQQVQENDVVRISCPVSWPQPQAFTTSQHTSALPLSHRLAQQDLLWGRPGGSRAPPTPWL